MIARYHVADVNASNVAGTIVGALDQLAGDGARRMLQQALEAEVEEPLGRRPYQGREDFRGYRNGHGRELTAGIGT